MSKTSEKTKRDSARDSGTTNINVNMWNKIHCKIPEFTFSITDNYDDDDLFANLMSTIPSVDKEDKNSS